MNKYTYYYMYNSVCVFFMQGARGGVVVKALR